MNDKVQKLVLDFIAKCEGFYGKTLKIHEAITIAPRLFDRHSTTYSTSAFILKRVGWRVSGGMLMLEGETFFYEISASRIVELNESEDTKFEIFEQYTDTCYRRSNLRFE